MQSDSTAFGQSMLSGKAKHTLYLPILLLSELLFFKIARGRWESKGEKQVPTECGTVNSEEY